MRNVFLAAAAALLASPAWSNTLIDNVNGIQVGPNGKLQHFWALLIGDDGKVLRTIDKLDNIRLNVQQTVDGGGKTLLPGLIDAHGHVMWIASSTSPPAGAGPSATSSGSMPRACTIAGASSSNAINSRIRRSMLTCQVDIGRRRSIGGSSALVLFTDRTREEPV